jgi:hypothetical protein
MNWAEPVIGATAYSSARVPQNSHSGGIFKEQSPVIAAEFSGMASERGDLNGCGGGIGEAGGCQPKEDED